MPAAAFALLLLGQEATVSFSGPHGSTFPNTVKGGDLVRVGIRELPRAAEIRRAVLHLGLEEGAESAPRRDAVRVVWVHDGREVDLPLLPPRFASFDATAPVRDAHRSGRLEVALVVKAFPGYASVRNRLDVTAGGLRAPNEIPRVTGLRAFHRGGQTFLTWEEIERRPGPDALKLAEFNRLRETLVVRSRRVRYRVYRAGLPIDASTIREAEFVDEVAPLSGWNAGVLGSAAAPEERVPRYVVADGAPPVEPGVAVRVVETPRVAQSYYAVSTALDGEEDLSAFDAGNSLRDPVKEAPGAPHPVLQETLATADGGSARRYVRWEGSTPFDYRITIPQGATKPVPGLFLHGWGGGLDRGGGPGVSGTMRVSAVMTPVDGWLGRAVHQGTLRSWAEGGIRTFTQERLLSFFDWACGQAGADRSKAFAVGVGLGGGGAAALGFLHPGRFAWTASSSGVHRPGRSPVYTPMLERVFGPTEWGLTIDGKPAFERLDQAVLAAEVDGPPLVFTSSPRDRAGDWEGARSLWKALQEARRPHVFTWGGGGEREPLRLPEKLLLNLTTTSSVPAFTRGSLDRDPDKDREGQSNLLFTWDPAVVEAERRWEASLAIVEDAPVERGEADVTPRRCRAFRPAPGTSLKWSTVAQGGELLASGTIRVDERGRATVPKVGLSRRWTRLVLEVAE